MRRVAAVALVVACVTSCSARRTDRQVLLDAIARTRLLPARFSAVEGIVRVDGVLADSLRYAARVTRNGQPVREVVVSDDAAAVHEDTPDPAVPPSALVPADPATAAALASAQWVVDAEGAPSPLHPPADDPVFAAVRRLDMARTEVERAAGVQRFSTVAANPVYRGRTDPFEEPPDGGPVVRYDLVPPPLPSAATLTGGGGALPGADQFREMAVYVRGGVVVEIRDVIDVAPHLEDIVATYRLHLAGTPAERATQALRAINNARAAIGMPAVVPHAETFVLGDIGRPQELALPSGMAGRFRHGA